MKNKHIKYEIKVETKNTTIFLLTEVKEKALALIKEELKDNKNIKIIIQVR